MTCRAAVSPPICPAVPKSPYAPGDCITGWTAGGYVHDCALREWHEDAHECLCGRISHQDQDDHEEEE